MEFQAPGEFPQGQISLENFQVKSPHVVPVMGTRCFPMQFIMLNRLGMVSDAIHAYGDEQVFIHHEISSNSLESGQVPKVWALLVLLT